MKKTTIFSLLLVSSLGFSQSDLDKVKRYLNENNSNLRIAKSDADNIVITDEFTTSDNVKVFHIKQTINGIELHNNDLNFLMKNDVVYKGDRHFLKDIKSKAKTSKPSFDLKEAFTRVITLLGDRKYEVQVAQKKPNSFILTNSENGKKLSAQLVYHNTNDNQIKLAYSFELRSNKDGDFWNVIIDANTGDLLEKNNLTIKCSFENHNHPDSFGSKLFKEEHNNLGHKEHATSTFLTPGTTNYNVVPWNYESPLHYKTAFPTATEGRALVTNPENAVASPKGWHDTNTINGSQGNKKFSTTQGNNVHAYDDKDGNDNTNGTSPTGTGTFPSLTFNFPFNNDGALPSTYTNAATTNLFYMNNIMHDLWFQYGFNEANKNFQATNYTANGTDGDEVYAEAQDRGQTVQAGSPKYDNANFYTPVDGQNPIMQMYLWENTAPITLQINSGSLSGSSYNAIDNNFTAGHVELPISPTNMSGDLVLMVDDTADTSDGCTATSQDLTGKIVVIRRGGCAFTVKAINAQNAGAKAVIIVNNSTAPWGLGGGDAAVTIPVIGLSQADGEALIASLSSTVNITFVNTNSTFYLDGDFDNGIVAHEYGHGISTRLSGNCLGSSEQMGEGWSDWFWLMMQIKAGDTGANARGIGNYVTNQQTNGAGIRRYPYSTDMNVNPQTYADLSTMWYTEATVEKVDVHSVGSVWATILWDLAWAYIDKYGYDSNIYTGTGGNNQVMKLVLDAIKLDGCNPSFITGRDAILEADQTSTGGDNFELIWRIFARRGVGYSATSGASNTGVAGIKDNPTTLYTDLPPTLSTNGFVKDALISVFPNPSNGLINIIVNSEVGDAKIQVVDLNGRTVFKQNEAITNSQVLNLNHLQKGIYLLQIKGSTINYTKKIVIE